MATAEHAARPYRNDTAQAAVSMRDGHQEVFARGADGQVWHKWWYGSTWSGWASLGGGEVASPPAAVSMQDNHIELFEGV